MLASTPLMVQAADALIAKKREASAHPERLSGWEEFLKVLFPQYVVHEFSPHQMALWDWVWGLEKDVRPTPFIAIWPRGSGKSTSAELAASAVGMRRLRKYILYLSGTQEQADKHVNTIASMLESCGVERALTKYGHSKGWRRNRLRAARGFTIDALGLDTAVRGIKVEEKRPGMIILDDIDELKDTPEIVKKKEDVLTQTILPLGAPDCAVLGVQNLVHKNSIFSHLAGDADYLADRHVSGPFPALRNFEYKLQDGKWVITHGDPVWSGQDVATCQEQITTWGLNAFKREAQQDTTVGTGNKFRREWFEIVEVAPLRTTGAVRYYDLAATEQSERNNDPDYTAGCWMVRDERGVCYILDAWHKRALPLEVQERVKQDAALSGRLVPIWIELEPGASGMHLVSMYANIHLPGFAVRGDKVTGNKMLRADPLAAFAEAHNVKLLRGDWNKELLDELENFPGGAHDDLVDVCSGAYAKVTMNSGEMLAAEAHEMVRQMKDGTLKLQPRVLTDLKAQTPEPVVPVDLERIQSNVERVLPALWAGAPLDLRGMTAEGLNYLHTRLNQLAHAASTQGDNNRAMRMAEHLAAVDKAKEVLG